MAAQASTTSCPRCDASVTEGARFCSSCGSPLTAPTAADAETHGRLTSAAPPPLIQKMRTTKPTGERKPVTALFADVVGSTTLAERMDPEDWSSLINEAFDLLSRSVFRYEGTIAQLQGDAMLAFFGAPVAHEDDPERAVLAALDMLRATQTFGERLRADHGIDFRIRVGIDSGPVVVGNVGSDLRYEYTALGDAVNVAARMQTAAEPGTVLVTANTRRLLGDAFELEDRGGIEVKGKSEPVHAFRILGRKAEPGRKRGLERAGLSSPMVGRDEPLALLADAVAAVDGGRGSVAFVIGEPGIGKSRLLAELRRLATTTDGGRPPTLWIEGHCVSYGRSLPYHLLIDLVRDLVGIPFAAEDEDARRRLDTVVAELVGDDGADAAAFLAHLLSLPLRPDEAEIASVDPETMQARYAAATTRLLRGLTRRGSVIVVAEDLHWADPASIDVLRGMLPLLARLPILFVGASRADPDAPGARLLDEARLLAGGITEIRLEPLGEDDSRALVANLLVIESLPPAVRDLILSRAEGNPFFVEEVVRMLMDRGSIVPAGDRWVATDDIAAMEIPETLHGLLLARIDQLPDTAKHALRVAAVIGRQFPARVLERVVAPAAGAAGAPPGGA